MADTDITDVRPTVGSDGLALPRSEALMVDGRFSPRWSTAFVSSFALMFGPSTLVTATFGVLASGLERQTGWTHSAVTYGSTIISIIILLTSPLQGFLADRFGGRRLVLVSMPCFAAALIALNFATASLSTFYLACAGLAITGIGLWPLSHMKVVAGWFDERVGLALGVANTGIGIGSAIYPVLLGSAFVAIGWGTTYAVMGLITLLLVWPVVWFFLREPLHNPSLRSAPRIVGEASSLAEAAARPVFWIAIVLFFTLGVINAALLVHGIAIMKASGISPTTALRIQSLLGVCAIIARLGAGWLLDRVSVKVVAAAMFAAAAIAFSIYASPFARSYAVVAACLVGLVFGAEFDVLGVLIRRHLGNRVFGRAYGVTFAGFHLGGATGSAGFAIVLARTGSFLGGLEALIVACIVCTLFSMLIKRDPPRALEAGRA